MKTLAIDSATEACSVALYEDEKLVAGDFRLLGRGHAEQLVPMIASLPGKGRAERIVVSLGPGSFTGVRIGLAAARALGLAWGVEVLGYPTLALIAAMARGQAGEQAVSVCMTGGHGEWFVQDFGGDGMPEAPLASLPPEAAGEAAQHELVAGTQAEALAAHRREAGRPALALPLWPDARQVMALPRTLLSAELAPLYGRGPDARLPGKSA